MGVWSNLFLPRIRGEQLQMHVTHKEALHILDWLVHISVKDRTRNSPSANPADYARYIAGPAPTGTWAG